MTAEDLIALGLGREAVMAILSMQSEEEEEIGRMWAEKEAQITRLREEIGQKDASLAEAVGAERAAAAQREELLAREHGAALERAKAEQLAAFRRERIGAAAEKAGFRTGFAKQAAMRMMEEDEGCEPEAFLASLREKEPCLFLPEQGGAPVFTVPSSEEEAPVPGAAPPFVYLRKPVTE